MKRDDSDDLVPVSVTSAFTDAANVSIDGVNFLVSSSTLSLHSASLRAKFNASEYRSKPLTLDVGQESFTTFLKATVGILPNKCTSRLLDDLITLGATHFSDYYFEKSRREMGELSSELRLKRAEELLKHMDNQFTLDRKALNSITGRLSNEEMDEFLRTCSFVPKELKDAVEAEMQTAPSFSIFVKTL
ncbi:hypothetical protein PFISCL1PPCAC_4826, partial [Pristionchus fissidentatus]